MKYAVPLFLALSAIGFNAQAADCTLSIDSTDGMKFTSETLTIPTSCEEFTIELNHVGKLPVNVMGHNIAIAKTADISAVATDGLKAGADNSYIKPDDERVIAFSELIGGGESTTLTFSTEKLQKDEDYSFFCSFPGHWSLMKGKLEIK